MLTYKNAKTSFSLLSHFNWLVCNFSFVTSRRSFFFACTLQEHKELKTFEAPASWIIGYGFGIGLQLRV